ncbi:penicillin-binding protein 2 [Patescibacteria group bacterium]|nr:penicillin-binding protein 2 [Patescibacteria group bacterium]MBU1952153.1 penicillin-binding protein 2 [Patescibacteria group bacterium]
MNVRRYSKATKRQNYGRASSDRKKKKFSRIHFLVAVFTVFVVAIVVRLFSLQVLQHGFYEALAEGQHAISQLLLPDRGEILAYDNYSKEPHSVATNLDVNLVFAIPKQIENPEEVSEKLLPYVDLEEEELLRRLSKEDDIYEPIEHNVSDEKWEELQQLNLPGIDATTERTRYYPEKETFSHLTGFIGFSDDQRIGQYGIEGYFDEELAGEQGFLKTEQDAGGRWITVGNTLLEEAKDGNSIILTIDHAVQFYVCDRLAEAVQRHGASEGSAIVMNPSTGAILAMCNAPEYDANNYSEVENIEVFINSAVSDQYEPGSVFKTIAMAAALDMGAVTPTSTYEDTGEVKIGKYTIRNSDLKAYGIQTMTNVLENSLNTGAIHAVQEIGNKAFYQYVSKFGFGEKTGIELEGENPGDVASLATLGDIYAATASYGQGITVTPIQLINAYAVAVNGGNLMRPYIVGKVIKENGFEVETEPEIIRQVISAETSRTIKAMLVSVVNKGHASNAQVPGYFVGGKTGTAQIAKSTGVGYESTRHNDTFVGFAPVDEPEFVVLTKINEPKDVPWAASSAAPLFGDIMKFLVDYYQIPPDEVE